MDALRRQIARCWNPPVGAVGADAAGVRVAFSLTPEGQVEGQPQVVSSGSGPVYLAAADSAVRAVRRCAPYSLPFEKYEAWREVVVNFDPRDMLR